MEIVQNEYHNSEERDNKRLKIKTYSWKCGKHTVQPWCGTTLLIYFIVCMISVFVVCLIVVCFPFTAY